MSRSSRTASKARTTGGHVERVGTAELRGNLAKYLRTVESGHPLIIQDRGRDAYLLSKLASGAAPSIFGCMRDRTDHVPGSVTNAGESWSPGAMP